MLPAAGESEAGPLLKFAIFNTYNCFLVLTIYDYILTFPHEINHIWRRKFTGATALFLVTRYLTLAKVFLLFRSTWSDDVSVGDSLQRA